jgi:hypothetical protein
MMNSPFQFVKKRTLGGDPSANKGSSFASVERPDVEEVIAESEAVLEVAKQKPRVQAKVRPMTDLSCCFIPQRGPNR